MRIHSPSRGFVSGFSISLLFGLCWMASAGWSGVMRGSEVKPAVSTPAKEPQPATGAGHGGTVAAKPAPVVAGGEPRTGSKTESGDGVGHGADGNGSESHGGEQPGTHLTSPTNHIDIIPQDRPWEQLGGSNLLPASVSSVERSRMTWFQTQLEMARQHRREKRLPEADQVLITVLESDSPSEFKRSAMYELALTAQEMNQLSRAQQILAQYLSAFPKDPAVPEVLLRQGLIYRQMGARQTAITKFYSVMTSSLSLRLDRMDYYRRLVLQAKTEIADTYYLDGDYEQAAQFFERLLKETSRELNRAQITVKLIRALSQQGRHGDVASHSTTFLGAYPEAVEFPEVRYLLAASYKKMERNRESMQQVLLLLDDRGVGPAKHPQNWFYWRQKAGNDIANQMYREADYMNALQIYLSLADLDASPAWQFPVWYQVGLVYEKMDQPQKALETYVRIETKVKELKVETMAPGLKAVVEMAQWRKEHIKWEREATGASADLKKMTFSPRR